MPVPLLVADAADAWLMQIPGVEVVPARTYLTDPRYTEMRRARVFNLCRSYRYQSVGYYVSLLATARGHKPMPSVTVLQDFKSQSVIRIVSEDLDELIQKSLAPLLSKDFVLSIYFGRNLAKRYDRLAGRLFSLFAAPFLRAQFSRNAKSGKWQLATLGPVAASEIPEEHRDFVSGTAQAFFAGKRGSAARKAAARYDLAILVAPGEAEPPSNEKALQRFVRAAESLGMSSELIEKEDIGRLAEFDALFIRETTNVNHHTYRFARRAAAEGLVVVDDPESILRCTNKVFLAELLERNRLATPRTLIVHRENRRQVVGSLGLPCILKQPDSSFSQGVVKVETEAELKEAVARLLEKSELVIAQEFLPTPFDWRIGVFDRMPLFACRYHMAKKHWQILKRDSRGVKSDEGRADTLALEQVPEAVLRTALKAANLIGDGLYGVDLKQVGDKVYVIEVNDNPNIDAGIEDQVLKERLYLGIMETILRRISERKERAQA
ncbi:ribosomal protein S6 modification protein [Desulfuromonas versatilis]|uniref:Ribosomal protein S6 modification protein n=1 Tax=Desulfuromonas versatilis TaxID=2802975 RepID=A0ABN6E3N3_9BACT|nr:RimK family protein [Desulfuromonas versatilis]BCR06946.1 ribosomal protein S6 modification protein [Desulfuromonas versatilis]